MVALGDCERNAICWNEHGDIVFTIMINSKLNINRQQIVVVVITVTAVVITITDVKEEGPRRR